MTWNVNGWTLNNTEYRNQLLRKVKPDICCLMEMHLAGNDNIMINDIVFISNNQKIRHVNTNVTHGGLCILINNKFANQDKV